MCGLNKPGGIFRLSSDPSLMVALVIVLIFCDCILDVIDLLRLRLLFLQFSCGPVIDDDLKVNGLKGSFVGLRYAVARAILSPIMKRIPAVAVHVEALLAWAAILKYSVSHFVSVDQLKVQIGHVVAACHIQNLRFSFPFKNAP